MGVFWDTEQPSDWKHEISDRLAKLAARENFTGPEPVVDVSSRLITEEINSWLTEEHQKEWNRATGGRQAKVLMGTTLNFKRAAELCKLGRNNSQGPSRNTHRARKPRLPQAQDRARRQLRLSPVWGEWWDIYSHPLSLSCNRGQASGTHGQSGHQGVRYIGQERVCGPLRMERALGPRIGL